VLRRQPVRPTLQYRYHKHIIPTTPGENVTDLYTFITKGQCCDITTTRVMLQTIDRRSLLTQAKVLLNVRTSRTW